MITERIKKIRKTLGLSQAEFAKGLGMSINGTQKWEYGTVEIKESSLLLISHKYNISIDWLKTGQGEMFNSDPNDFDTELDYFPEVNASAGTGLEVISEVPIKFNFYKHALVRMQENSTNLDVIRVKGDSMRPKYKTDDLLFVDTTQKDLYSDNEYVIRIGGEILVKMVQRTPTGVILISYNSMFRDIVLDRNSDQYGDNDIFVVGKVVGAIVF